ncbi:MAG: CDP-glycerol glycerophosphotransferase family protein [Ruminococcus sp.]|jgi:CDP-glycerol glycerophosphotransferase
MERVKNMLLGMVNQNAAVRRLAKRGVRTFWRLRYMAVRACSKTEENLLVFEVYQGRQYTCSPRAIYEEMLKKEGKEGYRFIWVFRQPEDYRWLEKKPGTTVVKLGTGAYYKAFARAKYWVVNSRTRHCLVPGKDQCFLQTWHGTPLKRLGCDIEVEGNNLVSLKEMQEDYRKEGKRVTYFLSPSSFYSEKIASAFGLNEEEKKRKVIELGYPRNDALFEHREEKKEKARKELGLPLGKKVILYAPTFRDNQHRKNGCGFTLGFDLERLVKELGEEYVMLFRTHYFVTEQIDLRKFQGVVFDVTSWDDINELYLASDVLITDYSSVFFDFANLKRPILFFMYDMEEYQNHIRDFYLDLEELPGPVIRTEDELYETLKKLSLEEAYDERYQKFHETYNYLDGPHTSRQVADWMLNKRK